MVPSKNKPRVRKSGPPLGLGIVAPKTNDDQVCPDIVEYYIEGKLKQTDDKSTLDKRDAMS